MIVQKTATNVLIGAGASVTTEWVMSGDLNLIKRMEVDPVESGGDFTVQLSRFEDGWGGHGGESQIAWKKLVQDDLLIVPHEVDSGQKVKRGLGYVAVSDDLMGEKKIRLKVTNHDGDPRNFNLTLDVLEVIQATDMKLVSMTWNSGQSRWDLAETLRSVAFCSMGGQLYLPAWFTFAPGTNSITFSAPDPPGDPDTSGSFTPNAAFGY